MTQPIEDTSSLRTLQEATNDAVFSADTNNKVNAIVKAALARQQLTRESQNSQSFIAFILALIRSCIGTESENRVAYFSNIVKLRMAAQNSIEDTQQGSIGPLQIDKPTDEIRPTNLTDGSLSSIKAPEKLAA